MQSVQYRSEMGCARFHAGFGFERRDFFQTQPVGEIGKAPVLHDDRHTFERCGLLLPLHQRGTPLLIERREPLLVIRGVRRIELDQTFTQRIGNRQKITRIGLDVRIACGVNIAIGAIQPHWHFLHGDILRRFEITAVAGLYRAVAGCAQYYRQPADFQFRAGTHHELRTTRLGDQAGARFDVMRVLQCAGGGVEVGLVTRELLRERGPFRFAGEHVECGVDVAG